MAYLDDKDVKVVDALDVVRLGDLGHVQRVQEPTQVDLKLRDLRIRCCSVLRLVS